MSYIQQEDRKAVFIFVGVTAYDFSSLSVFVQLINEPTHRLGLGLLLTDAPGVVDPPLGNYDHFSILYHFHFNLFFYPKYYVFASSLLKILSRVDQDL